MLMYGYRCAVLRKPHMSMYVRMSAYLTIYGYIDGCVFGCVEDYVLYITSKYEGTNRKL